MAVLFVCCRIAYTIVLHASQCACDAKLIEQRLGGTVENKHQQQQQQRNNQFTIHKGIEWLRIYVCSVRFYLKRRVQYYATLLCTV